jgi:hypothetical protein
LAAVESHIPNNRGKITLKNFGSPKAFITCEEMYTLQNLHVVKKNKNNRKGDVEQPRGCSESDF